MAERAPLPGPMYFTLGRTDGPVVGYTWRVWSSKTSFYLKSRAPHVSQKEDGGYDKIYATWFGAQS